MSTLSCRETHLTMQKHPRCEAEEAEGIFREGEYRRCGSAVWKLMFFFSVRTQNVLNCFCNQNFEDFFRPKIVVKSGGFPQLTFTFAMSPAVGLQYRLFTVQDVITNWSRAFFGAGCTSKSRRTTPTPAEASDHMDQPIDLPSHLFHVPLKFSSNNIV